MGLSNESPTQAAAAEAHQIAGARAMGQARALAKAMINYERNLSPMRHREAPNPAWPGITRIRKIVPMVAGRIEITDEVKRHNTAVSELRKP